MTQVCSLQSGKSAGGGGGGGRLVTISEPCLLQLFCPKTDRVKFLISKIVQVSFGKAIIGCSIVLFSHSN